MDVNHPKHSAAVNSECAVINGELCRFLSNPFDENFQPAAEQPTEEKKAELLRDAEAHDRIKAFWDAVRPDLPK